MCFKILNNLLSIYPISRSSIRGKCTSIERLSPLSIPSRSSSNCEWGTYVVGKHSKVLNRIGQSVFCLENPKNESKREITEDESLPHLSSSHARRIIVAIPDHFLLPISRSVCTVLSTSVNAFFCPLSQTFCKEL